MENQELTTIENGTIAKYQLTKPEEIVTFSKELVKFINDTKLSTVIQGEKYANVDAWKFAGLNFGLVPIVSEPISLHDKDQMVTILYHEIEIRKGNGKQRIQVPYFSSCNDKLVEKYRKDTTTRELTTDYFNYKVGCEIQNAMTGKKVGSGFGLCSNLELKKNSFDEFAVMSMAQTRAIGRAYKNVIGFIMKAAGYAPVPSEEMDNDAKTITLDDNTIVDIESAIESCTSIEELTKTWSGLTAQAQASRKVKNLFTTKKIEFNAGPKSDK